MVKEKKKSWKQPRRCNTGETDKKKGKGWLRRTVERRSLSLAGLSEEALNRPL